MLDTVALNLHRIDKDVQRCDRNYWYFTAENLEKLRNIMCSYVWEHLDVGYVQGMCDLLAPLMVILDQDRIESTSGPSMLTHSTAIPVSGQIDIEVLRFCIEIKPLNTCDKMQGGQK
ncbi:UNVERIFIED_CONTAM: Small G protein signaling modulator 2 [Gekko kuhli]